MKLFFRKAQFSKMVIKGIFVTKISKPRLKESSNWVQLLSVILFIFSTLVGGYDLQLVENSIMEM